jgi:hypothetical protein
VPRNYAKEYREYHKKPSQRKNRSKRNSARRLMRKKLGEGRIRGKDIDHKDKNPRNNSRGNLRVLSKSINRSVR